MVLPVLLIMRRLSCAGRSCLSLQSREEADTTWNFPNAAITDWLIECRNCKQKFAA
jgi:hypothetical protein